MKAKKALKKLAKVEDLLSEVADEFAGAEDGVAKALDEARASVVRARQAMDLASSKAASNLKPPSAGMRAARKRKAVEGA